MPTVSNPYVLLGGLVLAIGFFLSGFFYGRHYEKGQQALDVVTVQNQVLNDANRDVEVETRRSLASATAEAAARLHAANVRLRGERDAALKAQSSCSRDPMSMGLLIESINSANGKEAAANKLPEPVHVDP